MLYLNYQQKCALSLSSQAAELCDHELANCAAISLSTDGQLRVYNQTHLSSLIYNQTEWVTLMHLRRLASHQVPKVLEDVDFCCPMSVSFTKEALEKVFIFMLNSVQG